MTIAEAKKKLVDLARSEVGYREGPNNYTKYADDPKVIKLYGWCPQNQPWCCTFANWCYLNAFGYDIGSRLTYGGTAACSSSAQLFRNNGAFGTSPEVCDQAFFYSGGGINHTGIVVSVNGTSFTTVEGNYSDKVSVVQHSVVNADFAGVGRPCWKIVEGTGSATDGQSKPATPTKPTQDPKPIEPEKEDHSWNPRLLTPSNAYSSDCVVLQALLNAHHFACGSADGFFGAKTQAAVNRAQQYYGLTVDGRCGPQTWGKLLERG